MLRHSLFGLISIIILTCFPFSGYSQDTGGEPALDSIALRGVGPQGPGCDHTYAISLGDGVGNSMSSSDCKDTGEYYNYYGSRSNEVYYVFELTRPMVVFADHLESEIERTILYLEGFHIDPATGGENLYEIAACTGGEELAATESTWSSYRELLDIDALRNNPYKAFLCRRLEPGTYYLIGEGQAMNTENNGWLTTNFKAFGIPGDAFEYPVELTTTNGQLTRTDQLQASDYYDNCNVREGSDAIYRASFQTPIRLNLSATLSENGELPWFYIYNEQRNLLTSGQGVISDYIVPSGIYYFVVEMADGLQTQITLQGSNSVLPGDTFETPIEMGVYSDSFTWKGAYDTRDFTHADPFPGYNTNDVFHTFEICVPMSVRITHTSQIPVGTRILLFNSSGESAGHSESPGSDDSVNSAELFCLQLPEGKYMIMSEGRINNGPLSLHVEGIYTPDYVTDPVFQPSGNTNYIVTTQPSIAIDGTDGLTPEYANISVSYYDGLGRPTQQLQHGITPEKKDLAVFQEYDVVGRESTLWLPIVWNGSGGLVPETQIASLSSGTYGDTQAYLSSEYDSSPFARIAASYGPGSEWINAGRAARTEWILNTQTGATACRYFAIAGSGLVDKGVYPAGTLFITVTTDEDNHRLYTFTDSRQRQVLVRKFDGGGFIDTYSVYDLEGNLCFVLPPELTAGTLSDARIADLGYSYYYDVRGRCIGKRLPGCGWMEYFYDKNDQLIFSQDAQQAERGEWTCSLSDIFGRSVITALTHTAPNRAQIESRAMIASPDASSLGYALPSGLSFAEGDLLQINYYDNYGFLPTGELNYEEDSNYGRCHTTAKGLLTGSRTAILGNGSLLLSATYYDDKQRAIQVRSELPDGGLKVDKYLYDFPGNVLKSSQSVRPTSQSATDVVTTQNRYDHASRRLASSNSLNGSSPAFEKYTYDALGRLNTLTQGAGANAVTSEHSYNVRGWLTAKSNPLFDMSLRYTSAQHGGQISYTGNIAEWSWRHGQGEDENTYAFAYDALSRLTNTERYLGTSTLPVNSFVEKDIAYDRNGNMLAMKRFGQTTNTENLHYTYDGNKLMTLANSGTENPGSFSYAYDLNGNMTVDGSNNLDLSYNRLNLIEKVEKNGATLSNYSYLSDGTKFSATDASGNGLCYLGSLVYNKQGNRLTLESAAVPGGRIIKTNNGYDTRYFLTDHLGSVRAVVNNNGIVQELSNYYPYGSRWNDGQMSDNRYHYNGKENQSFVEVPYLDYGARMYNGTRWINMDPLAEITPGVSPFAFCGNNPIRRVDRDGKKWVDANKNVVWNTKAGAWTKYATQGMQTLGNTLRSTPTGMAQFDKLVGNPADTQVTVNKTDKPKKYGHMDPKNGASVNKETGEAKVNSGVEIVVYELNAEDRAAMSDGMLTTIEAMAANLGHEIEHMTDENITLNVKKASNEEVEEKPKQVAIQIMREFELNKPIVNDDLRKKLGL